MSGAPDYLRPYADALADGGARFEALLWRNADAQRARFDVAVAMSSPAGAVVADIGSGLSDYAVRLGELGIAPALYLGVEGLEELTKEAEGRTAGLRFPCEQLVADFVADERLFAHLVADRGVTCMVFSGSLNTLKQHRAARVLRRAWDALAAAGDADRSRTPPPRELVFNFLSDRHGGRRRESTGPATRFQTARFVDWAMRRTPLVRFRQDYLAGHDATIVMRVPSRGG